MAMRNALSQNKLVTFAVALAGVWTVLTALRVWNGIDWSAGYVGQTATSGIVGLLVIGGLFALMLVLYGELESNTPAPETFPPEE
ncbi:hypothetical protein [Halosegnis marinus]|uniref:Uncharacterized protein n=1 Tax=Halosegnis marinus TaxID=3034023 RepID=A0ABD5ZJV7_9EURY|nr:hypothetical protein [Halosegnis sp. DT85]